MSILLLHRIGETIKLTLLSIFLLCVFAILFPFALISVAIETYHDVREGKKVKWWGLN